MDDYKSLIEKLRNVPGLKAGNIVKYLREAADAIEELRQTVDHYKDTADHWYVEACDYKARLEKALGEATKLKKEKEVMPTRDDYNLLERRVRELECKLCCVTSFEERRRSNGRW